jgi:hypothetical protein
MPVHGDSDVLVLALVTAQALEAQGELHEAAQWLRRAAQQARAEGHARRAFMIARAAADLTSVEAAPESSFRRSPVSERPARDSFLRTTSPGKVRSNRASLRSARISAPRGEGRPAPRASVWDALIKMMGAAG